MANDLRRLLPERVTLRRFFMLNVKLVETALEAEPVDIGRVNVEFGKLADKAERLFLLDVKVKEALFNDETLYEEDCDPDKAPSRLDKELEEVETYRETWCTIVSQRRDLVEKQVKFEPPGNVRVIAAENVFEQVNASNDKDAVPKEKAQSKKRSATAAGLVEVGEKCVFCSGEHKSESCQKARKLALDIRLKALKDNSLCFKCLQKYHGGRRCKTVPHCLVCSKSHATAMCSEPMTASSNSDTSSDVPPESDENFSDTDTDTTSALAQPTQKKHMKIHRKYKCSLCDYRTTCQSFLDRHSRTHTGEKPFACRRCSYRASRKHHLERHMMTHNKEKPYACDICDYRAIQKIQLTHHMMSHKGKRPFACDECDYTAIRKVNLAQHKKTHSDEKPYMCNDCDYSAKLKWHLRQHIVAAHYPQLTAKC